MIKMDANEGEVYDKLSTEEVKKNKYPNDAQALVNYLRRLSALSREVGEELHLTVVNSAEYKNLLELNSKLFDTIDMLKSEDKNRCYDEIIDNMNFKRAKLKQVLQNKFFPDSPFTEQKFGYKK